MALAHTEGYGYAVTSSIKLFSNVNVIDDL